MHELQNVAKQEGWHMTFFQYENKETLDVDLKELVNKLSNLASLLQAILGCFSITKSSM